MEQVLQKLGLNKKEAKVYLLLLNNRGLTPPQVAKQTGETRMNAYAILDSLVEQGLAFKKEVDKKFTYSSENPTKLKIILRRKEEDAAQASKDLASIMPNLLANFRISQNKPGVLYLEGVGNFKTVYEDILRTKSDVVVFPSRAKMKIPGLQELVEDYRIRFKKAGIKTRTLYREEVRGLLKKDEARKKGLEIRFWDAEKLDAQIIVYGDNVVLNTFTDTVFTTVVTDPIIAKTMGVIFDAAWSRAKA